jgi:hypothetical protein
MAIIDGKQWFRDNIKAYLKKVKAELATVAQVTGTYSGKAATFAGLPNVGLDTKPLDAGDWSILTVDDVGTGTAAAPLFPAGVYVLAADKTTWELVQENQDLGDLLLAIIATDAEVDAGAATDKVATVKQLAEKYAKLAGLATQTFSAADGNYDTKEVINGSQFNSTPITDVEAIADWDAIVGNPGQ